MWRASFQFLVKYPAMCVIYLQMYGCLQKHIYRLCPLGDQLGISGQEDYN